MAPGNNPNGTAFEILILGGVVLTMEPGAEPIENGYVGVAGGLITAVGPRAELDEEIPADKIIRAENHLIMPGLVNGHTHAAMTAFRGLADDLPLATWLNEHIFPAEAAHVDEELVYWGARLALAEMLLSGTTCLVDGYFIEDQTARAVHEAGIRAVLGQGVIDFPAPGVPDPKRNVTAARDFLERWKGVSPLITPSVFCHSPYTCSASTLENSKKLAAENDVFFQIHVAETRSEVEQMQAEKGATPIRYLDALGLLDESTLAVHCVYADDEEIDILAEKGVPVVVCPESQMKLASGLARLPAMLERGVKVCLGTDGPASNNDFNLFGEMRSTALAYKAINRDPTILPAPQVLSLGCSGGAAALGLTDKIGRLTPGRKADLITVDFDHPNLKPMYHPFSHLVYALTGHEVSTTIVDGKILMEKRRLTSIDCKETMARVREISTRIR
ncbi:MAG: amidohydrolase [Deltaproteobacteria bacterium]|nr:amidohydrolase [Deltaproteobacteria bacterium]